MQSLSAYLDSYTSCVNMQLDFKAWNSEARIPSEPGWYFIRTDAPVKVLQQQRLWATTYTKKRSLEQVAVRNYDIAARARRYATDLARFWNIYEVYSGMASSLKARAREHTFPDPGTAGLALSMYPALRNHEWLFGYVTLSRFATGISCPEMLLRLGEQVWRAKRGWPLLCSG